MLHDAVNHPAHYTSDPSGVECIQITEHRNFCVGNAIKYLWRAGLKPADAGDHVMNDLKHLQDLKKARWYIDREIARLEREAPARPPAEQRFLDTQSPGA